MTQKKDLRSRNIHIDIMKGLCIILMVWGHGGIWGTGFVSLFHMSVFFMISGFLYSGKNMESFDDLKKFFLRKIKSLWLPYALWNAIFTLCNNWFVQINIYGGEHISIKDMLINIVKGMLLGGGTQIGGALWFLKILFVISVFYACVDFGINCFQRSRKVSIILQGIIAVLLLCGGYYCNIKNIELLGMTPFLSCYILFYIGNIINGYMNNMDKLPGYLVICISAMLLLVCNYVEEIAINLNHYNNPITFIIAAISGWLFIYKGSRYLERVKGINYILTLLGSNTLPIVILHLLCFKIVNYAQVEYYNMPLSMLASFPVLQGMGLWRLMYVIVGITIPVLLNIGLKNISCYLTKLMNDSKSLINCSVRSTAPSSVKWSSESQK